MVHWLWLFAAVLIVVNIFALSVMLMTSSRPVPPEARWGARCGLVAALACIVVAFV